MSPLSSIFTPQNAVSLIIYRENDELRANFFVILPFVNKQKIFKNKNDK